MYSQQVDNNGDMQAAASRPQGEPDPQNLWRWRPDAVAINETLRKIAILEHSRPFEGENKESRGAENGSQAGGERDNHGGEAAREPEDRNWIRAAATRKRKKYQRIVDALRTNYGSKGWEVVVLPWIVGVRRFIDSEGIRKAMEFLGIPVNP